MVEFTEEEEKRYQELVRRRAEIKAKKEAAKETEQKKTTTAAENKKKGILERVADKAENARASYNTRVKAPVGRIKNAVAPAKEKPARPARHAYSGISNRRAPKRQQRVVYRQPVVRQNDIMQDSIMGPPSGKSSSAHLNDMIGLGGSGGKGGMDFMNTMIGGSSSGKKKGGEFWREMLGGK